MRRDCFRTPNRAVASAAGQRVGDARRLHRCPARSALCVLHPRQARPTGLRTVGRGTTADRRGTAACCRTRRAGACSAGTGRSACTCRDANAAHCGGSTDACATTTGTAGDRQTEHNSPGRAANPADAGASARTTHTCRRASAERRSPGTPDACETAAASARGETRRVSPPTRLEPAEAGAERHKSYRSLQQDHAQEPDGRPA